MQLFLSNNQRGSFCKKLIRFAFFLTFLNSIPSFLIATFWDNDFYQQEAIYFVTAYENTFKKRKNRIIIKNFIEKRNKRVQQMRQRIIAYEPINQDSFDYELNPKEVSLIKAYKDWVLLRVNYSFQQKGDEERWDYARLRSHLEEYKNSLGDRRVVCECEEEWGFHYFVYHALKNYPTSCHLI